MITAYSSSDKLKPIMITAANQEYLKGAIWIDLLAPTYEEEYWAETALNIKIPTQEEMREIELSSRLYIENGNIFMTAAMVAQSESIAPEYDTVTFILTASQLITIRYITPLAFKLGYNNLLKIPPNSSGAVEIFLLLLEASVDRLADVLEFIGRNLDNYAGMIFPSEAVKKRPDYPILMKSMSEKCTLNNKARESLVNFMRVTAFFMQSRGFQLEKEQEGRLGTVTSDLTSLSDYAAFISNRINFLLDATLGMVNIEQNNIIKIFSVAAVIFLPPTLIASIYGMNFQFMPELNLKGGYIYALFMMGLSAWLPYKYFKYRGWL